MTANDQELLRRFVEGQDEPAFGSLVQRHLGWVLGAACRQLGGDRHTAEDLAQRVFTQLASKAPKLLHHPCLEGWLYRATRLACLGHVRLKARRDRREQEAAMNLLQDEGEPRWERVAAMLDEAMAELEDKDRDLILMRHVRAQSGAEVAARLGISEPAARKQLERAMSRLRTLLAGRGVVVGALALATLLETEAQAQFSSELARRITGRSISEAASTSAGSGWLIFAKMGVVAALTVASWVAFQLWEPPARPPEANATLVQPPNTLSETSLAGASAQVTIISPPSPLDFSLRLLDRESGQPVTQGSVSFWVGPDQNSATSLGRQVLSNGVATVQWTNDCHRFLADVTCEGFADIRLEWVREQQTLPVPVFYEARLDRAQAIGGTVVDPQGAPIASASVKVWANGEFYLPVPDTHQPAISYPLRQMRLETQTDSQGRWILGRIAREVQNAGMVIQVEHPDYSSFLGSADPLSTLQAGEFRTVLQLVPASLISGVVLDASGKSIPNAGVTDGVLFSRPGTSIAGDQHVLTDAQGAFSFPAPSRWQGKGTVTAKAPGHAAQSLLWMGQPLSFRLTEGKPLRLRVVSTTGEPIPGVRVESCSFQHTGGQETNISTSYQLTGETDAQGQVAWDDVPNETLLVNFWSNSADHLSRSGEVLHASPEEQVIELDQALKVIGIVEDAQTHQEIPAFRVFCQDVFAANRVPQPKPFGLPTPVSGQLFEAGRFELALKPTGVPLAPSLSGPRSQQRLGSYLKITAPGYAAYTSRFLDSKEGEIRLRIQMRQAELLPIQVVGPAGTPETGIEVVVCSASSSFDTARISQTKGDYALKTGAQGWVNLPADDTLQWVAAFDRTRPLAGWASMKSLEKEGVLKLSQRTTLEAPHP